MEKAKDIQVNITYDPEKSFTIKLIEHIGEGKHDRKKRIECSMLEVEYVKSIEDKLLSGLGEISVYDIGYISTALKALTIALENAPIEDDEKLRKIIEMQKMIMERVLRINTIRVEGKK